MTAQTVFESKGFTFQNLEEADQTLSTLEVEDLWELTESLQQGALEVTGDENTQTLVLRHALLNALENDSDSITQEDFNQAFNKVTELDALVESPTEVEAETTPEPEAKAPKTKKVESRVKIYPIVKQYVEDNPDQQKSEVVETLSEKFPDTSSMTVTQYFYKARKELGLDTNGQRGRPKNNTVELITELYQSMIESTPAEIKAAISEKFDLTEKTAVVYFHKAKKAVEANK